MADDHNEDAYAAAWGAGRTMSVDQAVAAGFGAVGLEAAPA